MSCPLHAQVITTVAGPGRKIVSLNARADGKHTINNPNGVATDHEGNVYVAEYWDGVESLGGIFRFNPNEVARKKDGYALRGESYPPKSGHLIYPHGIATDHAGNVYVAEYNTHMVRKISADGEVSIAAGNGAQGFGGDNGQATAARLSLLNGIAIDAADNLYIADEMNHCIRKVTAEGIISTIAGTRRQGYTGDGGPAIRAQLNRPYGVAVDNTGNLYFSDTYNNVIRKISADGTISTVGGDGKEGYSGDGGNARAARLNKPKGIALDNVGNIYIADEQNQVIRKIGTDGVITTVAGNGTRGYKGDSSAATAAQLNGPRDVAVDPRGNIFIADFGNHVLRKVDVTMRPVIAGLQQPGATGLPEGIAPGGVAARSLEKTPAFTPTPGAPIKKMRLAAMNELPITIASTLNISPPQRVVEKPVIVVSVTAPPMAIIPVADVRKIHISKEQKGTVEPQVAVTAAIAAIWADIETARQQALRDEEDKVTISVNGDNIMTIRSEKGSYTSFSIGNTKGEQIMEQPMKGKQTDVDVKLLENGQYFITLKGGSEVKTLRFVKEN